MAAAPLALTSKNAAHYVQSLLPIDGAPLQPGEPLACVEIHGG
jgi:hypothetical protein